MRENQRKPKTKAKPKSSTTARSAPIELGYLDILNERQGWGKDATGGAAGDIYRVTTLADSGRGSLRAGLESDAPLWIVFDVDGKISAAKSIYAKSNKTIDGRGRKIQIKGNGKNIGPLRLYDANNFIILNVTLDDEWPDYTKDSEGADGITIKNAKDIWVHHCLLQRWSDGAIDMTGDVFRASITWSRLFYTYQALALRGDCVTLAHNYVRGCAARFPKALVGRFHSYNNVIREWKLASIQSVKEGGTLLAEHNIYLPGEEEDNNVNEVADGGGRISCHAGNNYPLDPTDFIGGKDKIDAAWAADSRKRGKLVKCANDDDIKKLFDGTKSGAGPTLRAVSYATAGPRVSTKASPTIVRRAPT